MRAVLTALVLVAAPAAADARCVQRDVAVAQLADRHGEHPRARGLSPGPVMVELFVSPSGSWTMMITRGDGLSCPLAAGHEMEMLPAPASGDPS